MEAWRAELYHHGIKGMRWGIRRTPAQLGHVITGKKNKPSSERKAKTLINGKKMAMAGLLAIGTVGIVAAAWKYASNKRIRKAVEKATEADEDFLELMRLLARVDEKTNDFLSRATEGI